MFRNLKLKIEAWIKRLIAEVIREEKLTAQDVLDIVDRSTIALQRRAADIHASAVSTLTADHAEVLSAKADLLDEVKRIHNRLDSVEAAAVKGFDTAKDTLVAEVKKVHIAERRTCDFCHRLVHSFVVEAGAVKCTDCKVK